MTTPRYEMPARLPTDGAVNVYRLDADHLAITVSGTHEGYTLRLSLYNAWRVFGALALLLGIRLPAALAKAVKL